MHADLLITIAAGVLLVAGIVGTILPALPGPPLAWAGLLVANFSHYSHIRLWVLVITAVAALIVTVLDYTLPASFTRKSGGSKAGVLGSTIGLIVGMFLTPIFMILGPFIGAFIGEIIHDSSDIKLALKAAVGTFKGFLFGTGLKLITVLIFVWIFVFSLI